jgi:nucleoside-diphosphate-sugar epimerase
VFGGAQQRPNIHIDDIAELYVQLLEWPDALVAGETFNAGYHNHSVAELAQMVRRVVEQEIPGDPITIDTSPSNDLRSYRVSSKKIAQRLGYVPARTIEDAIRDLCRAFRDHKFEDSFTNDRYINVRMLKKMTPVLLQASACT